MPNAIDLTVNGKRERVNAEPEQSLLSVLREELDLTGAHYGCGEGQCGACTVLLDGTAVRSCITPASAVRGRKITTVEGLEQDGKLHPLQEAFLEAGAMQCAYCTSGMLMSGVALLRTNSDPSRSEILQAMNGNICRCGTYPRITEAINRAAKTIRERNR